MSNIKLKKGEILITITIGIMCAVLTAVIFVQFKTINQTDIALLDNMRDEEIKKEIASTKLKYEETVKKIEEINEMIAEYQEIIATGRQASETLARELNKSNQMIGKSDVSGERSNSNYNRWCT